MALPQYHEMFNTVLQALRELGGSCSVSEMSDRVAQILVLPEEEVNVKYKGNLTVLKHRLTWTRNYLKNYGLLENPTRGVWALTPQGHQTETVDSTEVRQFVQKRFQSVKAVRNESKLVEDDNRIPDVTPEEALQGAYLVLRKSLADELLKTVMESSSEFFEHLVVDLLVRMGYGGSRQEAGEAIGRAGDEGIDGIIKEDRLGLDIIYVQAKRWENGVGRPDVQKFAGALQGQRARKGVFITTSDFSRGAMEYVENIETKIILIGGNQLAELMIDHGVGVTTEATYELKRIDSDYFPYE